jgi:hypothetical protein
VKALHPDVKALAEAMRLLEMHLRQHDAPFWADHIAQCLGWIENSDAYGLSRFLALFGGMGSLNDLVLQRGDDFLSAENDQLQEMLGRTYEMADQLRREASR